MYFLTHKDQFASNMAGILVQLITAAALRVGRVLKQKKWVSITLLIIFMVLMSMNTQADPAPPTTSVTASDLIDEVTKGVTDALSSVSSSGTLKEIGDYFANTILVILISWNLVKTMATGRGFGDFISEMVPVFISYAFVYLFTNKSAADMIVGMMETIGSAVAGTPVGMSNFSAVVNSALTPTFQVMSTALHMDFSFDVFKSLNPLDIMANVAMMAFTFIYATVMKLLTLVLIILSAVIVMATLTMGYMSLQLALAFAPVMVPFIMFRPMSWVFDSWLRFFLGSTMLFIVVAFFQKISTVLQEKMAAIAAKAAMSSSTTPGLDMMQADITIYSSIALLALLSGLLMASAPGIANGLISGGGGATGFGGLRGLAQGTGSRAATLGTTVSRSKQTQSTTKSTVQPVGSSVPQRVQTSSPFSGSP